MKDCPRKEYVRGEYLDYVLSMAFADGLLDPVKQAGYVRNLDRWFEGIDIEAEYALIQSHGSSLSTAMRRRVVALVEYERDKARLGPGSVKGHEGLFVH